MESVGRTAYEAYRNHTNGVSLASGQPIPEWENLPVAIKEAWTVAGQSLLSSQNEHWSRLQADRDRLWDLLHEAAGRIATTGLRDELYERITQALDGILNTKSIVDRLSPLVKTFAPLVEVRQIDASNVQVGDYLVTKSREGDSWVVKDRLFGGPDRAHTLTLATALTHAVGLTVTNQIHESCIEQVSEKS